MKTLAAVTLLLAACTSPRGLESKAPEPARSTASVPPSGFDVAPTEYLNQGWTEQVRQDYYYRPQGSHLMPYVWAKALENADDEQLFLTSTNLTRFGYIPQAKSQVNPDGLPVGFTKDAKDGVPQLGINCAACHTSEMYYRGRAVRIDGGPAAADFQKFVSSMDAAIFKMQVDQEKFRRFADRLFGRAPNFEEKRASLRTELAALASERAEWQGRNGTSMEYGPARNDAFGIIFNQVLDRDLGLPENRREPNAPVSYPVVWDAHQHDIVQWIGIARANLEEKGPLSRNIGQVLGVFGQSRVDKETLKLKGYCSSARRANLERLEEHLKTLWSPQWPEELLGKIDSMKAQAGRQHFESKCLSCHGDINRVDPARIIHAKMIPISQVQTDAKVATNAADRTAKVPKRLVGKPVLVAKGRPMKDVEPATNLLRHVVAGTMIGSISPITCGADEDAPARGAMTVAKGWLTVAKAGAKSKIDELLTKQLPEADAPQSIFMVYKARPLNGVWSSAPFLHNGSVKNLREMLMPAAQRTTKYAVGCQEFDPRNVGFECAAGPTFDASIDGNSNAGHEYGTDLSEAQRDELVEYLKTL